MHRQSLGSPSTKQQQQLPSSSSSSSSSSLSSDGEVEKEKELNKKLKLKTKTNTHENYIHLIPILTLLCFLILYLSSHNPSPNDLDQFIGLKHPSDENISEMQRVVEIKSGDILAIRGLKNIKRGEIKQRRLHRKMADF